MALIKLTRELWTMIKAMYVDKSNITCTVKMLVSFFLESKESKPFKNIYEH